MKPVIYVAHPVSGDARANALNASEWVKWLTINEPTRIYVAPWVAEVLAFGEDTPPGGRDRIIGDDMIVVGKLDGVILTGGRISPGMRDEASVGALRAEGVVDISKYRSPADAEADGLELEPYGG